MPFLVKKTWMGTVQYQLDWSERAKTIPDRSVGELARIKISEERAAMGLDALGVFYELGTLAS